MENNNVNQLGGQTTVAQSAKALMRDWIGVRKQIQFWLSLDKARDCEVYDIINWFKSKGLFRSSVMTGLRVVYAYMHNDFDTIYEALPNLKGQDCNEDLSAQIADLKQLVLQQGSIPATNGPLMQPTYKPVTVSAPVATVTKAAVMDADSIADNFLSMFQ